MTADYNNRFCRCAKEIIRCYGAIGPAELARRTGITPENAYIAIAAWRGITFALRHAGLLPNDGPVTIEGEANGVYEDNGKSDIVSLEQAQKLISGPQLMTGPISRRRGL
jgi:hypothetical protein